MTTYGRIGILWISEGIEWNIADFFRLAENDEKVIVSPDVFISESHTSWRLKLFPRWKEEDQNYMGLYLRRNEALDYKVECSFGLRKCDGSVVYLDSQILESCQHSSSWNNFVAKKELLNQKSELVPDNTLTIICTMKFGIKITPSTKKSPLEETVPSKLSKLDKLSENIRSIFNDKESCDVTLKVKDKEYKAHKIILTARSSVFAANFKHDTLEKQTGIITITDCDPNTFQAFLEYLYCGELEQISSSDALHLYYTSDKYDVGELKEFCIEHLMQNLTVENVCEVAAFADKYDQTKLYSAVQDFFNKNVSEILETSGWECFMRKDFHLANKFLKESLKVNNKK